MGRNGIKVYRLLVCLLAGIGGFLSLWIIVTAPIFSLYPLSVGAPEISPWLIVVNSAAAVLSTGLWIGENRQRFRWQRWIILGCSLVGFLLSCLPLMQFPIANQQFAAATAPTFRSPLRMLASTNPSATSRPAPFVWQQAFTGIPIPEVRFTPDVQFAAPDGVPLTLDIYRPVATGRYPAVVMIHGGAWQGGSAKDNPKFNRYLAAQGYTVVAISYRLAPRFRFPAQLDDVQTALKFINRHADEYEIDPTRLAVMGRSAGAHLALLVANQRRDIGSVSPLNRGVPPIQAVISYYGPLDLTQGYQNPPIPDPINSRAVLEALMGGSPDQLADLYQQASPMYAELSPKPLPTLLVYGGRDHVVKATLARQYRDRLLERTSCPGVHLYNTLCEPPRPSAFLLEIPWAEHAFDAVFKGVSNQLALYYTERFLAWALR